jgi:hypothetical protein
MLCSTCLTLVALGLGTLSVAQSFTATADTGGVLFYAGFDGTRNARAKADGKANLMAGGGALTADGFDSVRRSALRTGDGLGYLEFSAEGNVLPDEGTIEMWIRPGNWSANDKRRHVFVEIVGQDGGVIRYGQGADNVNVYSVKAPRTKEQKQWDEKYSGLAAIAQGSGFREGLYKQVFLIWKKGHGISYYRGYLKVYTHRTVDQKQNVPSPGKLKTIRIGDFGRGNDGSDGSAFSYIDEVYIYSRALSWEECVWANKNWASREPGTDIPADFAQPTVKVVPDPRQGELEIRVDSGNLEAVVHGVVGLEPAAGTSPAKISPDGKRHGVARIPYKQLTPGDYRVLAQIKDANGKSLGEVRTTLTVPEDPAQWLGNKIGISDTPPPPFTPMRADDRSVDVWGRAYKLGVLGLPEKIVTTGKPILAGPVRIRVQDENKKDLPWKEESRELTTSNAVEAELQGVCSARNVEVAWRCRAEYDGLLRYDFSIPAGTSAGGLQLRIPIRKEFATLFYTDQYTSGWRGELPRDDGTIWKTTFIHYLWVGNEAAGLCAFQEDDRGWIEGAGNAMRLERHGDAVTLVYDLAAGPFTLREPWHFTFGLQATPVKPRPKDWRLLRASGPGANNVECLWPNEQTQYHFTPPSPRNLEQYRNSIKDMQAKGWSVIPFSTLNVISPEVPEYVWFQREWAQESVGGDKMDKFPTWTFLRVVPSWIDFVVWKNVKLLEQCGYDGIYVDFGGAKFPFYAPELGVGYDRGGQKKAGLPIFRTREIYKRIYTAFKQRKPDSLIWGHVSSSIHVPVLAFCDIWLNGEGNWKGQLEDNYLDALPLDVLRAEFMGHQYGGIPWFLPQWTHAQLEDKDVAERFKDHPSAPDGSVKFVSTEKCHHMFGLGLLHDFSFWPICGTYPEASKQFYGFLDEFGMGDVEFFGYWDNADLIGGQTEQVKASAYRKPPGRSLLVVYNTTREAQRVTLLVDWNRLKSDGPLEVFDAYTKEPVTVSGKSVTIEVAPLNYRLLWTQ